MKTFVNDSREPGSQVTSGSQRVLVVEDEPDIAALIGYQLTRAGFRVETTLNGVEALRAVGRDIPDLIVLDRMLPGISGDEVLGRLKDDPKRRSPRLSIDRQEGTRRAHCRFGVRR